MKRILRTIGLLALVLVVGVVWLLAATFLGQRAAMDGQELDVARIIADGFSSVAVVPMRNGRVVLVDAGADEAGEAILMELARRRLGPEAVAAILLTHGYADHTGAIGQFPRAQVMALEAEVPLVEGRTGSRGPITQLFPVSPTGVRVSRVLRDGDVVRLGDTSIRVYAVPGHTAGSAAYFVDGVLFVGDSADVASDGSLQGSPWIFSDRQTENRASLVRLEQKLVADGADATVIVASHSGTTDGLAPLTDFARANEGEP